MQVVVCVKIIKFEAGVDLEENEEDNFRNGLFRKPLDIDK
ncbi:MAG: hypothetical protein QG670_466 [Thermoproteota archaeon]|nr:hypothetical protein [Thermoproteota archaeon]